MLFRSTNQFEHVASYEPQFKSENFYIEEIEEPKISQCKGLNFSEILSYYDTSKSEQFIELYNVSAEQVLMDGCMIRYKNKKLL